MLSYLAISTAAVVVCGVIGGGFYVGVRHVEALSEIERNTDRPTWAQQPVDAVNHVIGRPTSPEFAEAKLQDDADSDSKEDDAGLDSKEDDAGLDSKEGDTDSKDDSEDEGPHSVDNPVDQGLKP